MGAPPTARAGDGTPEKKHCGSPAAAPAVFRGLLTDYSPQQRGRAVWPEPLEGDALGRV
jgi:hypothetical protein